MKFSLRNKDNDYQFSPKLELFDYSLQTENGLLAYEITMDLKALEYSELSFKIPKYYNSVILGRYLSPVYEKVSYRKFIHVDDVGYFIVDNTEEYTDGIEEYKTVTCYSAEYMFTQKYLDTFIINMGTAGSIDKVVFYNKEDTKTSLLNRLLEKFPMWSIIFPNLDTSDKAKSLASSQRSFYIDRKSVYDFMIDDIYNSFEAVLMFDVENFIIYPYPLDSFSDEVEFKISKDTLAKDVTLNYNESNIITSLYCTGGDGMEFRAVNCGYSNVENVSFFKECFERLKVPTRTEGWFIESIQIDEYAKYREEKNNEYFFKYLEASKIYSELFDITYYEPTSALINICTKYNGVYNALPKESEFYGNITYYYDYNNNQSIYTDIGLMAKSINEIKTILKETLDGSVVDEAFKDVIVTESLLGYNFTKTLLEEVNNTIINIQTLYKDNGNVDINTFQSLIDKQKEKKILEEILPRLSKLKTEKEEDYKQCVSDLEDISTKGSLEGWLETKYPPSPDEEYINNKIIKAAYTLYQNFIVEDELTDDSFVLTDSMWRKNTDGEDVTPYSEDCAAAEMMKAFKKRCEYELQVVSHPQISFEANIINLFKLPRYKYLQRNWELGNYFYTEINACNEEKVRLQEIHFDFDNPDNFSCTFSNQVQYSDNIDNKGNKFKKLFGNLTSFAKQKVAYEQRQEELEDLNIYDN